MFFTEIHSDNYSLVPFCSPGGTASDKGTSTFQLRWSFGIFVFLTRRCLHCRKNDPTSRPHSWHTPKLTEEDVAEEAAARRRAGSAAVWQPKHEAR